MKNKIEFKKTLICCTAVLLCFVFAAGVLGLIEYRAYTRNFNERIDIIVSKIAEKYPEVTRNDIIKILDGEGEGTNALREYGVDLSKESLVLENDRVFRNFTVVTLIFTAAFSLLLVFVFMRYNGKKDKALQEITRYIEELNSRNYTLKIDDNSEDELSILKNEVCKTTVMLREAADNSLKDKAMLKESISDISHQLRTPLTSILIMLDNILDNPEMDEETRTGFIRKTRGEIINISFLTESLLKLSKFDANTVKYTNRTENVHGLLSDAAERVSLIADLKNVAVNIKGDGEETIVCDKRWQTEAFSNIIKNCIEHSPENSEINISFDRNKLYEKIEIRDSGCGISKEDLPHIFERFYKGKNSSKSSIGIGLALAKSIVEAGGGYITADSEENKGTTFTIKYPV